VTTVCHLTGPQPTAETSLPRPATAYESGDEPYKRGSLVRTQFRGHVLALLLRLLLTRTSLVRSKGMLIRQEAWKGYGPCRM
jgi:hypothetical protein